MAEQGIEQAALVLGLEKSNECSNSSSFKRSQRSTSCPDSKVAGGIPWSRLDLNIQYFSEIPSLMFNASRIYRKGFHWNPGQVQGGDSRRNALFTVQGCAGFNSYDLWVCFTVEAPLAKLCFTIPGHTRAWKDQRYSGRWSKRRGKLFIFSQAWRIDSSLPMNELFQKSLARLWF